MTVVEFPARRRHGFTRAEVERIKARFAEPIAKGLARVEWMAGGAAGAGDGRGEVVSLVTPDEWGALGFGKRDGGYYAIDSRRGGVGLVEGRSLSEVLDKLPPVGWPRRGG